SALADQPMSLPGTVSAREGDLWSHFISIPGTSPDFLPCVSVSDEFFALTSSKKYAEQVVAALASDTPAAPVRRGLYTSIDLGQLVAFSRHWLALVKEENAAREEVPAEEDLAAESELPEELPVEDGALSEAAQAEQAEKIMAQLGFLDRLGRFTAHERRIDGRLHSSIHLEIKDRADAELTTP
ncbi:MAG: hypothetical protein ACQKBY_13475, partial [Verrucomicrobiales bacterium]